MKDLYAVIKRPVITEKSTALLAQNKYTLVVDKKAGKGDIKRAVEKLFGVKVRDIQTATIHGQTIRSRRRRASSRRSDGKKAIVTLAEGDKIDVFEVEG